MSVSRMKLRVATGATAEWRAGQWTSDNPTLLDSIRAIEEAYLPDQVAYDGAPIFHIAEEVVAILGGRILSVKVQRDRRGDRFVE